MCGPILVGAKQLNVFNEGGNAHDHMGILS